MIPSPSGNNMLLDANFIFIKYQTLTPLWLEVQPSLMGVKHIFWLIFYLRYNQNKKILGRRVAARQIHDKGQVMESKGNGSLAQTCIREPRNPKSLSYCLAWYTGQTGCWVQATVIWKASWSCDLCREEIEVRDHLCRSFDAVCYIWLTLLGKTNLIGCLLMSRENP